MDERLRKDSRRPENVMKALGAQEWFACAASGEKQSPIGSSVGVGNVRVFTRSWRVLVVELGQLMTGEGQTRQ